MSKEDLLSIIPILGKKLIEKEKAKHNNGETKVVKNNSGTSTENSLPFENVISNIIKVSDSKYRTIVRTNAISIDDMDDLDKSVIIEIYSEFLSGFTRAHQVFIPSFMLDIRNNIVKLEERYEEEEGNLKDWIEDDIELQKALIEENDIIDTQFYMIFEVDIEKPSKDKNNDYLKAKKILAKLVKYASDQLESIGLYIEHLQYEDIGRLYYYFLNPFSSGKQEPNFENNLVSGMTIEGESKKVKKKKEKKVIIEDEEVENFNISNSRETNYLELGGITFKNKIAPYNINDSESGEYIKIGSTYMTIYEIYDYPTNMSKLWAKKLYKFRQNIDVSIHILPIPTSDISKELDNAAINYGSALIDERTGEKKKATTTIEKKMEKSSASIDRIMDELDSADQSLYHFSMYILVKERNIEKLEETCIDLENTIGSMRVLFRKCTDNMRNAFFSVFPVGVDYLRTTRNMLTKGVANAFPFTNFSFSHKNGFFLATHKHNNTFIYFNPFELDNANGAVLGASGGGKSTVLKKMIKGFIIVHDIPVRVIDPEGENIKFANDIGAEIFDYYVGSGHIINILEPEPDNEVKSLIKPHINFVKLFLKKLFEIKDEERNKIDFTLMKLYEKFGFTDDKKSYWDDTREEEQGKFTLGRKRRKPPELYDLFKIWDSNEYLNIIGDTKGLAEKLREFTRLGSIDMFDGQTNVDFAAKRLYFNLKHMDKLVKEPATFVLFQKNWDFARKDPLQYKAMITMEAHVLLRDDEIGEYVYEYNKRIRKYGGASIYDTQNITDFMKTKWGPEIIKNCSWSILVKQNKKDIEPLMEIYDMTKSEAMRMTKFNRNKGEAYLIADKFKIPINVRLSQKELNSFTTKTSDLIRIANEEKENED